MFGSLLGLGVSAASSLIGGKKAKDAEAKYLSQLKSQERELNAWNLRNLNEDYMQRADTQRMLSQSRENAQKMIDKAYGVNAMMGGTSTRINDAINSAGDVMAETNSRIAAQASAHKDKVEQQAMQNNKTIRNAWMNYYSGMAQNATDAANQGMKAGMDLVGLDMSNYKEHGKDMFSNFFSMFKKNKSGVTADN